jgi:hypothetical protein
LRFAIKFLFIRSLRRKPIYTRLEGILRAATYPLRQVREGVKRFDTRNSSCQDCCPPGRPTSDLPEPLGNFTADSPYESRKYRAGRLRGAG